MPGGRSRPFKILVADDDRFVRRIARLILVDAGMADVQEADCGEACVAKLRDHHFDLALLDIDMPPLDGLSITRIIRAGERRHPLRTAVVIMTSRCDRPTILRAKSAGIDQLCLKPLSPSSLLRRVAAALTGPSATDVAYLPELQP